ncbi:MAG: GTPase ObgE [Anaerolineaceae bacterium]|nr:GTPase ObgE [Anaerolineaceae bacterium]
MMFIDEAEIEVESGRGGDGIVHFRREKYINRGGPDGGDGGKGGDIVFVVNTHLNTLGKFRHQTIFKADKGKRGGVKNQTGRSAKNLIIEVPAGTIIKIKETGEQLADLVNVGDEVIICPGGRGGRGNTKFANSRSQAPRLAEKGEPGVGKRLKLELKLIADIGIIGMPNAGKSSFLASVTNAKPKIADYPFTTLVPNLGVADLDEETTLILADIPGLIEGAHTGLGLGDTFLKHIQRTRVLIHLLDGLSEDLMADYAQINTELSLFDPGLSEKPQVVAVNKIDLPNVQKRLDDITRPFLEKEIEIFKISTVSRENLKMVLWRAKQLLDDLPENKQEEMLPVYHPESKEDAFEIIRNDLGWTIRGGAIERAAEMTYWEYFESIRRFHRILESMGITRALNKAGVKEGDSVFIRDHEFEWTDNFGNQ